MQRLLASIVSLGLLGGLFVGCGGGDATGPEDIATVEGMEPMGPQPDPATDFGPEPGAPEVELTPAPEEGPIDDLETVEPESFDP